MPVILHVDYMCNECGNCKSFCPYASAPYKDKFTLFANEADLTNSTNEGFAVLDHGAMEVLVRYNGSTQRGKLADLRLPQELKDVILAVEKEYGYLYL